jgi:hypothetical protein
MYSSSVKLQNEMKASGNSNIKYARDALVSYFIYYRIIHYLLSYQKNENDELDYHSPQYYVDMIFYMGIMGFLTYEWAVSYFPNIFHTLSIARFGKSVAPTSQISSCECKEKLTGVYSGALYVVSRYGINYFQQSYSNNNVVWMTSFILESSSFGYSLLEYKLAAVGTCTTHRYEALFRNNKLYFFWFGASFVSLVWLIDYMARAITNAPNSFYFYEATFNFIFNWYVLASLARTEKFPGGGKPRFDLLGVIKYLLETPPPQYVFKFLKKTYSPEAIARWESSGGFVLAYEEDITAGLNMMKNVLTTMENIHSSLWFSYVEWIAKSTHTMTIPQEIKSYCKKGYLTSKLEYIENLVTLAKEAQLKRIGHAVAEKAKLLENIAILAKKAQLEQIESAVTEKAKFVENIRLKDKHFNCENPSPNHIQEDWIKVESPKPMIRNDSGLFRSHRPLREATRKIIDEMKERKNISAVTQMVTSVDPALDLLSKNTSRRF